MKPDPRDPGLRLHASILIHCFNESKGMRLKSFAHTPSEHPHLSNCVFSFLSWRIVLGRMALSLWTIMNWIHMHLSWVSASPLNRANVGSRRQHFCTVLLWRQSGLLIPFLESCSIQCVFLWAAHNFAIYYNHCRNSCVFRSEHSKTGKLMDGIIGIRGVQSFFLRICPQPCFHTNPLPLSSHSSWHFVFIVAIRVWYCCLSGGQTGAPTSCL